VTDELNPADIMAAHPADESIPDDPWCSYCRTCWPCQTYLLAYTMRKMQTALLLARKSRTRNREARLAAEAELGRVADAYAAWQSDDDTAALLDACAALVGERA
jgi:hypothetical protein